jgi:preprotein translocase subunit Sss1
VELKMSEFLKSATIVLMGLTVIGAGVFVAFYG